MKRLTALMLALLLFLAACGGEKTVTVKNAQGFASPLKTALNALFEGDGEAYLKAFPPQMAEDYKTQDVYLYYYSLEDMGAWLNNSLRVYGDVYGKSLKLSGSISAEKTVDTESLGDVNWDYHTGLRYVTADNTEETRSAVFSYTIGGDTSKESKEATLYFVKQNGVWYLHPCFAFYSF